MNKEWELPSIEKRKWFIDVLPEKRWVVLMFYLTDSIDNIQTFCFVLFCFDATRNVANYI